MLVTCRLYRQGTVAEEEFDPSKISDALSDQDNLVWLDVQDPSEADLDMLQEEFSLHDVWVAAARERNQRPRVDTLGEVFFLAIYAFRLEKDRPVPQEIHVFVGPRFLITLRHSPAFDLAPVVRRWEQDSDLTAEGGGALLHALLDEVVDSYLTTIDRFEDVAERVETEVFGMQELRDVQQRIFTEKRKVLEFRRRVLPLREVMDLLQEERQVVTPALKPDYKDVADHVARTLEHLDTIGQMLTSAVTAHLSLVGHQLNEVVKKLTSWAAIILVPTLIAGIYGMNFFRPFPAFDNPAGFWIAIGMMLVSGGSLYWVFRRRGWM
jgi:magnesium transporter